MIRENTIRSLQIHQYYGFDHRKPEILRNEVFAPRVYADFSAIFGGSGYELSGQEMVDMYMKMRDYATAAQHCLSYDLILPYSLRQHSY